MGTYYLTIITVVLSCFLAEYFDYAFDNRIADQRVYHTATTRFFYLIASAILFVVSASRYYVGTDFGAYYDPDYSWGNVVTRWTEFDEPGFYFLAHVGRLIWDDGQVGIILAALFTVLPALFVIYRNSTELLMGLCLYMFLCWTDSFNGVRQSLAAVIIFTGYVFIRDRKPVKYAITVIIASLAHKSAMIMFVPYFILNLKITKKNILIIALGTIIALYSYDKLFDVAGWTLDYDSESYDNDEYTSTTVNILRVFSGVAPAIYFLVVYSGREKSKIETILMNTLIIHGAAGIAAMNSAFLYRITMYTTIFQTIAIPELLKKHEDENRKIMSKIIFVLFGLLSFYEIYNSGSLNPFTWYWW